MRTFAVLAAALVTVVACTSSSSAPTPPPDVTPRPGSICSADGWCWYDPIPQGRDLRAIWGSGPGDFWVVGAEGTLLHWNGNAWTLAPPATTATMLGLWGASAEDGTPTLRAVWGSGPEDVWTVGSGGAILRHHPPG